MSDFSKRLHTLKHHHDALAAHPNQPEIVSNGVFTRWRNPVVTAQHTPLDWRYDLNEQTNPFLMERQGINATFNPGAIFFQNQYCLVIRMEGVDRKSFFAVARSDSGVDRFQFDEYPIDLPQTDDPDTNVYDMRLTAHEDGYIYGLFCTERKDPSRPHDTSAAVAQCGIARTKDLHSWERLADLITRGGQQRNVVLHPELIDGQYGMYTRPQDGFIDVGGGGGIGWGLTGSMQDACIEQETIVDEKQYHTIKELKNGQGPTPIKTREGWLHLAHGVRNTAAGLRYVLYMFMTDLNKPWQITHRPGGYFLAPEGDERIGDVSNVVFANGWLVNPEGNVFIYYASSDTRVHVATSSIEQLLDYVKNTPEDGLATARSVRSRRDLIERNRSFRHLLG